MSTTRLARIAVIAALYSAITILMAPFSYGPLQVRVSEAMTVLPFIFPESTMGLFIGCLIANFYGGYGILDIVFGSLATLTAAYLTRKMPTPVLAPLPPVLVNALVVAVILKYAAGAPLFATMFWVAAGQIAACYFLGLPLLFLLRRYNWDKY